MATDPNEFIARSGAKPEGEAPKGGALEKFKSLPRPMQIAIVVVGLVVVFYVMTSLKGGNAPRQATVNLGKPNGDVSQTFSGIETDRPAVMQSVFEQNRRDMSDLRGKIEQDFARRDAALADALGQNQELQRQMQQMMGDFTSELKNMQVDRQRDSERLGQLADQQKQMEMNAPVDGVTAQGPITQRRRAISQVTLGGGGGPVQALKQNFSQAAVVPGAATHLDASGMPIPSPAEDVAAKRLPFMPPLGFVKATMLNGVDALVGGGVTPALARLSGTYKTAMGTTVTLDGCFALLEFEGNISTERAVGRAARMTCVYPDAGAATYSLSSYVVDAEDGIIGVPGVLYEGDPTRIAAAMMADFAAGVGEIIEKNSEEQRTIYNADGTTTNQTLPSTNQTKVQIAGGSNKLMSSLSAYLNKRVDRVKPFIRLDATREINLVILNGTELRHEGDVWSALFDASSDGGTPQSNLPQQQAQQQGQ